VIRKGFYSITRAKAAKRKKPQEKARKAKKAERRKIKVGNLRKRICWVKITNQMGKETY
jgi:hypothetical protein